MLTFTQEDRAAVRRGHVRHTTVELWTPDGLVGEVPYTDGEITFSLSTGSGNRQGRLVVPGYEWWPLLRPRNCGWVVVTVSVDGVPFVLGELPIVRAVVDRPRGTVDVTLGDWAQRRSQPQAEVSTVIGAAGQTVAAVLQTYLGPVLPTGSVTITRDDSAGAVIVSPVDVQLGGNVWSVLQDIAGQVGCQVLVTSRSTAQIRRWNPAAAPVDDLTGTVVRERFGELADEAVNRVIVQMESSDPVAAGAAYRSVITLSSGPYAYDNAGFGEFALVDQIRQPVATQAAADMEARRLFDRRAGVVATQSIEVVPQPWIQAGDVIEWTPSFEGEPLAGCVDTITFPFTVDGTSRVTLRDTNVTAVAA